MGSNCATPYKKKTAFLHVRQIPAACAWQTGCEYLSFVRVLAGQVIAYTVGGLTQDICVSLLPVVCSPVVDLQTNKIVAVYAVSLAWVLNIECQILFWERNLWSRTRAECWLDVNDFRVILLFWSLNGFDASCSAFSDSLCVTVWWGHDGHELPVFDSELDLYLH